MIGFDYFPRTRVIFGPGTADRAGALAKELGGHRVFLVTDAGLVAAGHCARLEASLAAAGIDFRLYADVPENPSSEDVTRCRKALGDWQPDLLIGLGGGSSIDLAKGCNFVLAGGGRMEDYWGVNKAKGELLPLIAIPTTAGTGTEVQSFALIEEEGTHQKMACGDSQAAPRVAILDPELTFSKPVHVTAATGMDALGHALETAVTSKRTPISQLYSREAFRLIQAYLPVVLSDPQDLEARGRMLRGSTYAGLAIELSMLGAAHSLANPLTARLGLPHGQAVGVMLPEVIRFNAEEPEIAELYAELARSAGICEWAASVDQALQALLGRVEELLEAAGFAGSLAEKEISEGRIGELAGEAARQWTAQFNPRPVGAEDFRHILTQARIPVS
ncbi:MAG: iron-containing alcohol dehydrogenase [Planctomycetota bacterium]|jgi:alcohol dehydrogenase